ncbi:MAG: ferrochelatase [Rhizobiales bacterium]|nr:ferrochelatase [Hyphomicrobiales bacterium]
MTRLAIVLFNLGGPDRLESVQPFLFNLFNDPAIIGLPGPLRRLLARTLAARRARLASEIYAQLGGGSPLLDNTVAQAVALKGALRDIGTVDVFTAMRYWHPLSDEVAAEVKEFQPERIVLLPLYPQYSTTTTGSSCAAWARAASRAGLTAPVHTICCYPAELGFIAALAALTRVALNAAPARSRVLFSAHVLPKRVVDGGDPYQWQVEQTAASVVDALGIVGLDWQVCYQSRVGPLEWIGPYTDDEIARAGRERVPLVVVPIAFVSEHSETLVELDITYRKHAAAAGVPYYARVPTVGTRPAFIAGLADLVRRTLRHKPGEPWCAGECCPASLTRCGQREAA